MIDLFADHLFSQIGDIHLTVVLGDYLFDIFWLFQVILEDIKMLGLEYNISVVSGYSRGY